jgi:ketosteroid isomerase-like protein
MTGSEYGEFHACPRARVNDFIVTDTVDARMRNTFLPAVAALAMSAGLAQASPEDDRRAVAALDTEFQSAVKRHDAATIDRIQHPDMVLVLGDGRLFTKADHIAAAREKNTVYEIQDEEPGTQVVRVHGDTAVVTALLRLKGTKEGAPFDRLVWFSDTYVRTPDGWKYFFGQASLRLPDESAAKP